MQIIISCVAMTSKSMTFPLKFCCESNRIEIKTLYMGHAFCQNKQTITESSCKQELYKQRIYLFKIKK